MPIWKFTTKMKRTCNGVFIEKGMTVDVVTQCRLRGLFFGLLGFGRVPGMIFRDKAPMSIYLRPTI